ncbi:MAG TPA: FAD:protein FMN transferase [Vicinamibacterales bacterium]|nr:FAD:protein FMN transferase [Vicinamibacterales bacterium]
MTLRLQWLVVMAIAAGGCAPDEPRLIVKAHRTMGSEVRVTVWTAQESVAYDAFDAVFAEFDRLDALLSIWKPGSDVLRINAGAGQAPVAVSPETIEILQAAQRVSVWTDGKFDITFGALSDVWRFDHDQDNRVPGAVEIAARLPLVDHRRVVVDAGAGTAFVEVAGMRIHLGGIGKGYAVDRAVALLRVYGIRDFMVQFGGDLYVSGQPGDGPWRLGINDPRGAPDESFATIDLRDATFSTSGDYERFFIADGVRYHHLLDPETGHPARDSRSVTIVAASAMVADALSTGVFIMGAHKGMELVERLPDVEAVIVSAGNEVLISSGLRGRVQLIRAPTP